MKHAHRLNRLPPYPFARWSDRIAAVRKRGQDVIRLDVGNPDLPPPDEVITALTAAARRPDQHGYSHYRGTSALRVAIADYYARRFDVTLDPETEVLPLLGSKEGIVHLAIACLDPGDGVLVPTPGYAPYRVGAILAGAQVHWMPLCAEDGFRPDLEAMPASVVDQARLMWLNYPHNPTGATVDLTFLTQAVAFARRHHLLLCHDAPYCDVTYDGYVAPSVMQVEGATEVAVEFNSLSKTFNMAGWRVGMAVGNSDALAALAQVESNVYSGMFLPLQDAAVQALSVAPEWIAARNAIYRRRITTVVEGLTQAGITARFPLATPYVWGTLPPGSISTSEEFAVTLLEQTGVALAPGSFFGPGGEGAVRISVTAPDARIAEAMARLLTVLS